MQLLELRIVGPGLDTVRKVQAGESVMVVGRDADCDICLPDPQRNVSRRHLAVWNSAGELHFRVLSGINGVQLRSGDAPPGTQAVLAAGEALQVGDYRVEVSPVVQPPAPERESDPWAVFEGQDANVRGAGQPYGRPGAPATGPQAGQGDEDPFGDWGFESSFGPMAEDVGQEQGPGAPDLFAFFHGLGLDAATLGPLSTGELDAMGRTVRMMVAGLLELHAAREGVNQDLHAEDRTMVAVKDNNPLKTNWPEATKLQYLFGGRGASVGFIPPERALRGLLIELLAHQAASGTAARAAVEGTVRDFSPSALRTQLLGSGSKLFGGARAWDAYRKYYGEHGLDMGAWVQRLLDRHFTEAYLRESLRIKREAAGKGG